MLNSEIVTLARILANAKIASNAITDTDVKSYVNAWYMLCVQWINEVSPDFYGAIDTTIDLVNGTATYALPDLDSNSRSRVMNIDRVEIAYDGTNFVKAFPISVSELPDTSLGAFTYTTQNPRFRLYGSTLQLLPTPTANATNAVKLYYKRRPLRMTSDSETPDIPDTAHELIAYGAAIDIIRSEVEPGYVVNVSDYKNTIKEMKEAMLQSVSPRDASELPVVRDRAGYSTFSQEDYVEPGSLTV